MLTRRHAFASALAAAALLLGCGGQDLRTVLHFWAIGREGEVIAQFMPEFERLHPDLRVEVEELPWTAAHEKLLTAVAGNSTPDLCQLGTSWMAEMLALKALAPLDEFLASSTDIPAADYFKGAWEANQAKGRVYGVPWYVDTRLLFYRTDLLQAAGFAAPPSDWGEWQHMLAAIRAQSHGERYGVLLPLNEYDALIALALQQKTPLLRGNGAYGNFTSPEFERTLAFYAGLFRSQYAPSVSASQIANVSTEFGRGYFTFYITGPWNIGEFKRRLPALEGKWMTAPLPGPDGPGASSAGGASLVVFRRSQHAQAAWQLIEFLSQPSVQQRFHALTGDLPPRRSAWQSPALQNDPYTRAFREQLERMKPAPQVAEWERIAEEVRIVAERVVRGDLDVRQGALQLDASTDTILRKRRELLAAGAL